MNDVGQDRQSVAVGLAGHAVNCFLEGLEFSLISLDDGCGSDPFIEVHEPNLPSSGEQWSCTDLFRAEATVRALLGGLAATERLSFGSCLSQWTIENDSLRDGALWRAIDIAGSMPATDPVLPKLWRQVARTTNRCCVWNAIEHLSAVLTEVSELSGHKASSIVLRALRRYSPISEIIL